MSTLSTHVLDTSKGQPAMDVPIALYKKIQKQWQECGHFKTNSDGRITEKINVEPGVYRLTFDIQAYHKDSFFPQAEIAFEITAENEHYHVPLLTSGWGYSTYRGS